MNCENCANCGYEVDEGNLEANELCANCHNAYELGQSKQRDVYPCADTSKFHGLTDFADWIHVGIENGWVTEPFCDTHNGDPYMSDEEAKEWDEGGDPCRGVIKIIDERLR